MTGCGNVAPHGATVEGEPIKCWKHQGGHCLARGQIRFVVRDGDRRGA